MRCVSQARTTRERSWTSFISIATRRTSSFPAQPHTSDPGSGTGTRYRWRAKSIIRLITRPLMTAAQRHPCQARLRRRAATCPRSHHATRMSYMLVSLVRLPLRVRPHPCATLARVNLAHHRPSHLLGIHLAVSTLQRRQTAATQSRLKLHHGGTLPSRSSQPKVSPSQISPQGVSRSLPVSRLHSTVDPHEHPSEIPAAASALSVYMLAHRYSLDTLAKAAKEQIMGMLTPENCMPMLCVLSFTTCKNTTLTSGSQHIGMTISILKFWILWSVGSQQLRT